MNYKVLTIAHFDNAIKRLVKKFPSLKMEYLSLVESLIINPKQGIDLGKNCYKIRIAIASKRKGKSAGARVITYLKIKNKTVYLLDIYDKSEKENISDNDLSDLLNELD